jgi:hypothetical protein
MSKRLVPRLPKEKKGNNLFQNNLSTLVWATLSIYYKDSFVVVGPEKKIMLISYLFIYTCYDMEAISFASSCWRLE